MLRARRLTVLATAAAVVGAAIVGNGAGAAPPTTAPVVRIYPLGDSITFGATYGVPAGTIPKPPVPPPTPIPAPPRVDTPGGYRGPLDALLTATGIPHLFVGAVTTNSTPLLDQQKQAHHDGHPGYRIDQDATSLDGRVPVSGDAGGYWLTGTGGRAPIFPDVTVIHLGTNDINQKWDPGTTYAAPGGKVNYLNAGQRATFVAHLTARLGGLVDKVLTLRPGSRIVLSTVAPWDDPEKGRVIADYNAAIADLVVAKRAAGARIVLADVWSRFAAETPAGIVVVPGLLSPDKVHPTPAGYAVMAPVYRDAIQAVLALP
jgi:lysophospholipase L1-like esterase